MADRRNLFRFRLPWAAPAPAAAAPRQGAAPVPAPSRPPFRPPGAAPVQPPPRAKPPAPSHSTTQPQGGSEPASPAPKPTSPLKTPEQTSTAAPKTVQPPRSPVAKPTSPRLPRSQPSPPSQTRAAYQPPPPQSAARSKSSAPSSPSHAKPRQQPTREPTPIPDHPLSPTLINQSPSSKKLENLGTQPRGVKLSQNALDSDAKPHSRIMATSPPDLTPIPESETKPEESEDVKTILDAPIRKQHGKPEEKEAIKLPVSNSGPTSEMSGRKPAKTNIPSHPKAGTRNRCPGGSKAHSHKEIKEDISRFFNKLGTGQANQTLDGNREMTIITLAGENRGASMTLSDEAKQRESSIHIHRGYKTNPDESFEASTDEEGRTKPGDSKTDEETRAYMNSNVQGVNNSLVFNGSVSTRNPGVRYVLSRGLVEPADGRQYETREAEFDASSSGKHAYAPTVRRRCLRALLMESSDSDADNPEKPRRHGCRYDCKSKNKDGNPNVL